jgi:GNAT superfamily N-acetyltransferase
MSKSNDVYDLTMKERKVAAMTLYRAFLSYPFMHWLFLSKDNYIAHGLPVIETWVKYAIYYGKAFRTKSFESVALRKKPGDVKLSFWKTFRSGLLKTPGLVGKDAFKRFELFFEISRKERQKNMGTQLFWHCWVLGTTPESQNKGYGSILMNHTFDMAAGFPCYLETATDKAKEIHAHKGYKILSEIILPESDIKE